MPRDYASVCLYLVHNSVGERAIVECVRALARQYFERLGKLGPPQYGIGLVQLVFYAVKVALAQLHRRENLGLAVLDEAGLRRGQVKAIRAHFDGRLKETIPW